jgi:hypothetical protein
MIPGIAYKPVGMNWFGRLCWTTCRTIGHRWRLWEPQTLDGPNRSKTLKCTRCMVLVDNFDQDRATPLPNADP